MIIPYICRHHGCILLYSEPAYVCRWSGRLLFAGHSRSSACHGGLSDLGWLTILVLGVLVLLTLVADYIIPTLGVRWFGGTPYGKKGSIAGTFAGLFFLPWGLIVGPFVGAFIGELIGRSSVTDAFRSGVGSLAGFVCGLLFKLVVTVVITCYSIAAII